MAENTEIGVAQTAETGAKIIPQYHATRPDVVGVPVMEIRDASSSAKEEIFQFVAGNFLASGAFWLGIERLVTVGFEDTLFLACIAFFLCGVVVGVMGFRQSLRRVTRLSRYIPNGDITWKPATKVASTSS